MAKPTHAARKKTAAKTPTPKKPTPRTTAQRSSLAKPAQITSPAKETTTAVTTSGRLNRLFLRRRNQPTSKDKPKPRRLPSVWQLSQTVAQTLWRYRALLAGIVVIYGLLNLLLVQGLASGTNVSSLKGQLGQVYHGHFGGLFSGLTIFITLLGSSGNSSSSTAGAYQVLLVLIVSLALIWALRQVLAGAQVRIRDAYYKSMYPLIPLILVLLVIGLQLIPLVIGTSLYSLVISNGIAVNVLEKAAWGLLAIGLSALSLYLVTSSCFALYIVTLPDMTPMKALRSARGLVRNRRLMVLRKIIFLPVALLIMAAIIMLPIIALLTPLAQWLFFILTMLAIAVIHTYMYSLYRELLNE